MVKDAMESVYIQPPVMTTITCSSVHHLVIYNSYCNQQALIIVYVGHPAITCPDV